jgi:DNA-binding Lrp family transcriptional regulator
LPARLFAEQSWTLTPKPGKFSPPFSTTDAASLKALAEEAGLSLPAVSERLKRLEEAGIVKGYRAEVNAAAVGYGVMAMIGMTTPQADKARLRRPAPKTLPEVTWSACT